MWVLSAIICAMPPIATTIAANVRAEIARAGRGRRAVATAAGMSYSQFTRRLTGRSDFTVPELERVAGALNVPLSSLLDVAA